MVQILFQNSNSEQLLANFDFSKVDEETKTELLNLKGIIQLNLGKYDDALMTFENLEKEDSTYEPAQFNLMTTHFLKGEFQEVIDQAKKMILAGTKDPAIFFMKNYSVFMQSSEKGKLDSAVEEINRISSKSLFLQNEFNLLAAGLQVKNGKIKEASITLQKLTRQDPELSENHAIQFQFARNSTQWKNLQPICNSIVQGIGDPSSQVFVEAYCLTKSGDYLGAASKIDQGKLQAPADQRLLSLQGYLLWKLNKSNEINTYIQNNLKMNNELFHLVYGWYCLSLVDSACSEREMKSVLKLNPQNISALVGLTQKEIQAKNFDTAQKYLKQGLSVSEKYRPLIQIKLQLAQTGPE